MSTSMVKGNPLKLMLHFALPLLIGNLLQQTYNIIDAAIVGQILGAKALASVGASSSVQFLVLGFCMGSCTGFGVPVAKYFGGNNLEKMRDYIFNGAVLVGIIAAVVTTICAVFCPQILHLLSVPEDIFDGAYAYLIIIFLGIPFTLMYNYLSGILRSVGDSRTPFMFLAFSACLNIFLDLFCIVVLKWGCAGAAIATILSQAISGSLCLVFIIRKMDLLWLKKSNRVVKGSAVKELLLMGIPTGLQFSITAIGSMVMQSANNGLGSVCVSGFTAGMRIKQFTMCPFDAFATAASVFCSQNLGAGKADRIKQGLRQGIAVAVGYGAFAGLILIFAGRTLSMIFVSRGGAGRLRQISPLYGIFLLDFGHSECLPYGDAGPWLFRQSRLFRCHGDAGPDDCEPWLCGNVWFYCDLFCRSDSLGGSEPLYCADVSLLHQEVYEEAGSGESNAAGVRNIPGCFA